MNKLVDKRVRINLYPYRRSAFMLQAFEEAARIQQWSDTEVTLVINQTNGLSLDQKYDLLLHYTSHYGEDSKIIQEDVVYMLHHLGCYTHYLCTKPITSWDEYDFSNYHSLKQKATNSVKRVFGLFSDSVEECDKYVVQTPPSVYYDTHEEALEAVVIGQELTTKIYALWIQNQEQT